MRAKPLLPLLTAVLLAGTAPAALAQATVQIVNINAADVGFNDATPVAPQPGNAATTLGQQRLNVFQRAQRAGERVDRHAQRTGGRGRLGGRGGGLGLGQRRCRDGRGG